MLVLEARSGGRATPALRRWVLHLKRLALSPAARRSVQRGTASAGALKMLAAFPRTSGPLLVLGIDGRRVRAQETTLWMTRKALRGSPGDAGPPPPAAAAARARRERPRRSRRPAAREAGPAADARRHLPQRRLPVRHRLAHPRRDQPRGDEPRAEHARLERGRRRLDAVHALDLAALGHRRLRATASPIRTTRRTRSSAPRATSTPPARARICAARSSPTTTPTGTSTRSSRSPPGSRQLRQLSRRTVERVDPGSVARRRAGRPERIGVRVGREHLAAALLARPARHALGPAIALACVLLEPVVAELGGGRAPGAGSRADAAQRRLDRALRALELDELGEARRTGTQRRAARRPARCSGRTRGSRRRPGRDRRARPTSRRRARPARPRRSRSPARSAPAPRPGRARVPSGRPDRRRGRTSGSARACAAAGARRARARACAAPRAASAWARAHPPRATTRRARAPG